MAPDVVRWLGVLRLGWRRTLTRALRLAPRQTALTISGIALPIAFLLLVTSISLGLVAPATVGGPGVDYWIVPESGGSSAVVPVEGPRFGTVHETAALLSSRDDVISAMPVLLELLRVEAGGRTEYVIAMGIVPDEEFETVGGVSTATLERGDPHYADGSYAGPRSDAVVLSDGAGRLLGVGTGDRVRLVSSQANRSVTVTDVSGRGPGGELPLVAMHLAELQTLTGLAGDDAADQLLVRARNPSVRMVLSSVYPRSTVVSRAGTASGAPVSPIPMAVGLAALVVAIGVGLLSAATTMGLSTTASVPEWAILSAIGASPRTRAVLLGVETMGLSVAGGISGVLLWLVATPAANALAVRYVSEATVVRIRPELVPYGLGLAIVIGLLVWPYLVWLTRRSSTVEALAE